MFVNMKKIEIYLILMVACFFASTLKTTAQNSIQKKDTLKTNYWHFEKEKGGAVCTDGLEKLELGTGFSKHLKKPSFVEYLQLHFDGPAETSGRIVVQGNQEDGEHFLSGSLDGTWNKFPLHLAYGFGMDQIHIKHDTTYVSYIGPGLTFYPSDIKFFHHAFHILRIGVNYEKLSSINSLNTEKDLGKYTAYSVFFQTQSFEKKEGAGKIYLEGAFKLRGEESYTELLIRYRHDKIAEGLINFGAKVDWQGEHFKSISFVAGLNLTRPNTAHL